MAYPESDSVQINGVLTAKYIAESTFEEEIKYWDLSFVFKAGLQFKSLEERFNVGANITFPNIKFI